MCMVRLPTTVVQIQAPMAEDTHTPLDKLAEARDRMFFTFDRRGNCLHEAREPVNADADMWCIDKTLEDLKSQMQEMQFVPRMR